MKCRLVPGIPEGNEWVYEIKFDGYRGVAVKNGVEVQLFSRNKNDLGKKFPGVVTAIGRLPFEQLVLDGEVVALDQQGRSSFQLLQRAGDLTGKSGVFFYAFDLLNLNGRDTTRLPLMERKAILQTVLRGQLDCIRFSEVLEGEVDALSSAMKGLQLEGLIAKKRNSFYEIGGRSGAWVKFKWVQEQEFVIGGYSDPEGSRPYFGSVLVGHYEGDKLIFVGKVGTGFDTTLLGSLYARFQSIRAEKCPFANLPERGGVIGPSQMRFCKWIEPRLVCQVRFAEWTDDEHLRQPVFLGLREDKEPREVVREKPESTPD